MGDEPDGEVFTQENTFDVGFPKNANTIVFDHGHCEILQPSTELLHSQAKLSAGASCGKIFGAGCLALSVIGLPVLCCSAKIVPRGKIALCRNCDGSVRIVGSGCHLKETLFTKVSIHS